MTLLGLYIHGFGGHARSVGDVALASGVRSLMFVDARAKQGEAFAGFPVVQALPDLQDDTWGHFVAIGDNGRRRALSGGLSGYQPSLQAPTASIGHGATIEDATLIGHQAHIGPMARIGRGSIINSGAVFDHESKIGAFSHVAVNATVAGRCLIGDDVFIGAGATVIDGIRIGDGIIVGAGATVTRDLAEPGIYVGTPAQLLVKPGC